MTLASRHPQISECHEERWQTPALQLDHFQQMMLEWDKIHPYNAVHTVRLAGRADALALQEAVHLACATAGIGELMVNHESRTYRY